MVPRSYAPEFRRRVVDLLRGGRPVSVVAAEIGVSGANRDAETHMLPLAVWQFASEAPSIFRERCGERRFVPFGEQSGTHLDRANAGSPRDVPGHIDLAAVDLAPCFLWR